MRNDADTCQPSRRRRQPWQQRRTRVAHQRRESRGVLPIVVDGRAFIDGGIASNTPIAAAFALGAPRRHRGPNPA